MSVPQPPSHFRRQRANRPCAWCARSELGAQRLRARNFTRSRNGVARCRKERTISSDSSRATSSAGRRGRALPRVSHAGRDLGPVTLSVGVAILPDHGVDATAIVKAADIALYRAKAAGRNRVLVYSDPESRGAEREERRLA